MIKNRILCLGGNGFIGTNLCDFFAAQGCKVTSFDLHAPTVKNPNVKYIEGNFFDDNQLSAAIDGQDIIIHSISTITPGNSNIKYMNGYKNDLVQTAKLCEMLVGTNTKLIFLSSGGTVYGDQKTQPTSETSPTSPINHYGCVKKCIENILRTFNIQFKTNFLIARVANPYGPGQDFKKGVGFIDAAIKNALSKSQISIWGDGTTIRDYIYIEDVCEMISALSSYKGPLDTFNISSGIGHSQNEVLKIINDIGYETIVDYQPSRNVDVPKIILDNSRILSIYDKQITTLEAGIKKYIEYLAK